MRSKQLMELVLTQAHKIARLEDKLAAAESMKDYWYKQCMKKENGNEDVVLFGGAQL